MLRFTTCLTVLVYVIVVPHVSAVHGGDTTQADQLSGPNQSRTEGPFLEVCEFRGSLFLDHPAVAIWCPGVPGFNQWYHHGYRVVFPLIEPTDPPLDERRGTTGYIYIHNSKRRFRIAWTLPKGNLPATLHVTYRVAQGSIRHKMSFLHSGDTLSVNKRKQTFDLRNGKQMIIVVPNGNATVVADEAVQKQAFEQARKHAEVNSEHTFKYWE